MLAEMTRQNARVKIGPTARGSGHDQLGVPTTIEILVRQ
jgi:hypothetical protein